MDFLHILLITVHAAAAVAAFTLGIVVFVRLPNSPRSAGFVAYATCVWTAVIALVVVVSVDWSELDVARRIAFPILGVLGLYMLWRTERARRTLRAQTSTWRRAFLGHVGFVLISFFDGFCIVLAIDLRLPIWVVVAVALLGVAVGILAIRVRIRQEEAVETKEVSA
ncbi:hypothetical protein HII28_02450 [Planctomonas sp. JC2975]|uniref:hypothetical protein n=1 Tax=Planctomonas sp. JC2975 TaxID=2729626 RepID=UPI001475FEC4|nr:hypothetical protein [Planctomonas sp. JC2975]NNC10747.1 hypothetical protein [Planctomonas sp. JC2975]